MNDPPEQVIVMVLTYRPYQEVTGWSDQVVYFLGRDKRWRKLVMSELGLDESAWFGPDTTWAGSVSPDGRRWVFPTATRQSSQSAPQPGRVAVMELATGKLTFYNPDRGRRTGATPIWIDDRTVAFDWRQDGHHTRALVNVITGETRRFRVSFSARRTNLALGPDGQAFRLMSPDHGDGGDMQLVEYSQTLRELSTTEIPFLMRGSHWNPLAVTESRLAFATDHAELEGNNEHGPAIVVTGRDLEPQAILTGPVVARQWESMAWLDEQTLMLPAGASTGRKKQQILAWRPADDRVYRLTTLLPTRDSGHVLVTQVVPRAVLPR